MTQLIYGVVLEALKLFEASYFAKTASRLSNMTFDEEKSQNLEDAISIISPVISDENIY